MKKLLSIILIFCLGVSASAQTAQSVMDKCASVVTAKKGAKANFHIANSKIGNTSGTIAIKGTKFTATTPDASIWFDGKTQWTYMKKTNEVNISTPNAAKQAQMNPLTFIYLYKKGYKLSLKTVDGMHEVHMQAQNKNAGIPELYVVIDKKTNVPSQVRMQQKGKWTTINISNFKATAMADAAFTFNSKDFPTAEIIDLR